MRNQTTARIQAGMLSVGVVALVAALLEIALVRLDLLGGKSVGQGLLAPLLVFTVAVFGIRTITEDRERRQQQERERIYGELALGLMRKFTPGLPQTDLAGLRANVATWGSVRVVESLAAWNAAFDALKIPVGAPTYTMDDAEQASLEAATTAVIDAIRMDIHSGKTKNGLTHVLFNQPKSTQTS